MVHRAVAAARSKASPALSAGKGELLGINSHTDKCHQHGN